MIHQSLNKNVGQSVWEVRSPFGISSSTNNTRCENQKMCNINDGHLVLKVNSTFWR